MKTTSMTCPKCGAPMKFNWMKNMMECEYCDNRVYLTDPEIKGKILSKASSLANILISRNSGTIEGTIKLVCMAALFVLLVISLVLMIIGLIFNFENLLDNASGIFESIVFCVAIYFGIKYLNKEAKEREEKEAEEKRRKQQKKK